MAYLKDFQKVSAKAQIDNPPNWLLRTAEAEQYALPDPSVYENQSDLYRKISWILSACENVAKVGAPVPFNVKKKVGEDERDISNHPFELLLQEPNPLDSRSELIKATIIMYMLNGNAYWWLNKPNRYAEPEEIWYIPPHQIIPNPDKRLYLKNYLYYPGTGDELTLEPWEIVHFRRFNPFSRFIGLSAVESIALIAFGDYGMASWNAKLFRENNGRLPGLITFEQFIPNDVWGIIKSDMDEAARKRAFLMLRGVGPGGVNWHQNMVSQREMEFLEGRKANRNEIWDVLAPGLVSYLEPSSTEANSRTGESAFERLAVFPLLDDMAEKITNDILITYPGKKLVGKFEDIRRADQAMELEKQKEYSRSHTVEEVRDTWYGDEPIGDDRDKMFPDQVLKGGANPPSEFMGNTSGVPFPPVKPGSEDNPQKRAAIQDLMRFERKALKSIGNSIEFVSDFIPEEILEYVHEQLPMCFTEKAVKRVFRSVINEM